MNFNPRQYIFPQSLVERDQWIVWTEEFRDGKMTKVPVNPNTESHARSDDPATWGSFGEADAVDKENDDYGLGFVFSEDDPFVGIDLDDVRDPRTGAVDEDARLIIQEVDSYTELSPSENGYHVIARGSVPEGGNRRGKIEMYDHGRFFTMTGNHVESTPQSAEKRQEKVRIMHENFVARDEGRSRYEGDVVPNDLNLEDEVVLENALNSSSGRKFKDLWNGDWERHGYESQSEADLALASMLAFWTGGNSEQVYDMFKDSGLYRDKWEEKHFSDGATYGERTVERAIQSQTDFYGS